MGQYHYLVNVDRKEIVDPHKLGLGLKQIEHTHCVASLSDVLYMLITTSPCRGGGDLSYDKNLEKEFQTYGRWVGDRCLVFGDYTEAEDVSFMDHSEVFGSDQYTDITDKIIPAFEKAFDCGIKDRDFSGYRNRELNSEWNWLFPGLEARNRS